MAFNPYQYNRGNIMQPTGSAQSNIPQPQQGMAMPTVGSTGQRIPEVSTQGAQAQQQMPMGSGLGEREPTPKPKITEEPSAFVQGLHQTLGSMNEDEKGTFLQAMREKLLQKVYRWQTAIARGMQPDESAMKDFESSKSALTDIQRYLTEPEFAQAASDYRGYMYEGYGRRAMSAMGTPEESEWYRQRFNNGK